MPNSVPDCVAVEAPAFTAAGHFNALPISEEEWETVAKLSEGALAKPSDAVFAVFESHATAYPLALAHIFDHSLGIVGGIQVTNRRAKLMRTPWGSYGFNPHDDFEGMLSKGNGAGGKKPGAGGKCRPKVHTSLSAGLGCFKFTPLPAPKGLRAGDADEPAAAAADEAAAEQPPIYAVHHRTTQLLESACGFVNELVLISPLPDGAKRIQDLCEALIHKEEEAGTNAFNIYILHHKTAHQGAKWRKLALKDARSVDSVVLPSKMKTDLLGDLDEFFSEETCDFFTRHGITYKRVLLFHGKPGSGKTSLIQALAGRFERNIYFLNMITSREMDDTTLSSAVMQVPPGSIVVLEDVDSLFTHHAESATQSQLTLSGVLNALDGVATPAGQLIVLTANSVEKLDPALVRTGRVDLMIEFKDANSEQMELIFQQFYPDAPKAQCAAFRAAVHEALGGRALSMASLQHFFVAMRKKTAEEAIERVDFLKTHLDERDLVSKKSMYF